MRGHEQEADATRQKHEGSFANDRDGHTKSSSDDETSGCRLMGPHARHAS
jgi:hypothetical protein